MSKEFDVKSKKIEGRTAGHGAYYLENGRDGRKRGCLILGSTFGKGRKQTYQCENCLEIFDGTGDARVCPKCKTTCLPSKKLTIKQFGVV